MEEQSVEVKRFKLNYQITDYSISNLLGLSITIVTMIFAITVFAIEIAEIHIFELFQGNFHIHGDPSMLYFATFLICATILIVIQHHFQQQIEED